MALLGNAKSKARACVAAGQRIADSTGDSGNGTLQGAALPSHVQWQVPLPRLTCCRALMFMVPSSRRKLKLRQGEAEGNAWFRASDAGGVG